jgi:hypothetical protein
VEVNFSHYKEKRTLAIFTEGVRKLDGSTVRMTVLL